MGLLDINAWTPVVIDFKFEYITYYNYANYILIKIGA